jgi:hypothetical protein
MLDYRLPEQHQQTASQEKACTIMRVGHFAKIIWDSTIHSWVPRFANLLTLLIKDRPPRPTKQSSSSKSFCAGRLLFVVDGNQTPTRLLVPRWLGIGAIQRVQSKSWTRRTTICQRTCAHQPHNYSQACRDAPYRWWRRRHLQIAG